jgi:hypothetical protein
VRAEEGLNVRPGAGGDAGWVLGLLGGLVRGEEALVLSDVWS